MNNNIDNKKLSLEEIVKDKINQICLKQGRITYKEIEHPIYNSYSNLDILNKRLLLSKLDNILVITNVGFKRKIIIFNKNVNAHYILLEYDNNNIVPKDVIMIGGKRQIYNDILFNTTKWYKFYINGNTELDLTKLDNILNAKINLKIYLKYYIIRYIMSENLDIPLIDFSRDMREVTNELKSNFDEHEINYIEKHTSF